MSEEQAHDLCKDHVPVLEQNNARQGFPEHGDFEASEEPA
jgi:hypothetical protein